MSLSYFFIEAIDFSQGDIILDEETSYHIVHVLRMKAGEMLQLTDGKGNLITGRISKSDRRHCEVQVIENVFKEKAKRKISIGISLIKNASRFEWFLEKATEIGVNEIIPLRCERTISQKFRYDRMKGICISAMLQSQQCWLPELHEPIPYEFLFRQEEVINIPDRFIAHCEEGEKNPLTHHQIAQSSNQLILIGPAGDFSPSEIELAAKHHFIQVSLGDTRLRTETAGIVAATLLVIGK